jgi:hypothetical protein
MAKTISGKSESRPVILTWSAPAVPAGFSRWLASDSPRWFASCSKVRAKARWGELAAHAVQIRQAAQQAGRNNRLFCRLLDDHGVPVPSAWGVFSWLKAYERPDLQAAIRICKSSAKRSRLHVAH